MYRLNRKLASMIVLTLMIIIPVCFLLDDPECEWLLDKDLHQFCAQWIFFNSLSIFWILFLQSRPPKLTFGLLFKVTWCTGLLAAFFMFIDKFDLVMTLAVDTWGPFAGRGAVVAFIITWLYTIFNYYFKKGPFRWLTGSKLISQGVIYVPANTLTLRQDEQEDEDESQQGLGLTQETRSMTLVTLIILTVVTILAHRGSIPNIWDKVSTFGVIWLGWIIMFFIGYLFLMRDETLTGWFKINWQLISWNSCWDYVMMTALISFVVTLYRHGQNEVFDLYNYFAFCSILMTCVIIFVHVFKFVLNEAS